MEWRTLREKKLNEFVFSIGIFGWKENERKENRRRIIFPYLFVWKSGRKERDNIAKWQFYSYIVIKDISTILININ